MRPLRGRFGWIRIGILHAEQLQLSARLNHGFGAVRIALARQFDDNLVVALPVWRHHGLRQSQRIDAAPDGLYCLRHCLGLDARDG